MDPLWEPETEGHTEADNVKNWIACPNECAINQHLLMSFRTSSSQTSFLMVIRVSFHLLRGYQILTSSLELIRVSWIIHCLYLIQIQGFFFIIIIFLLFFKDPNLEILGFFAITEEHSGGVICYISGFSHTTYTDISLPMAVPVVKGVLSAIFAKLDNITKWNN